MEFAPFEIEDKDDDEEPINYRRWLDIMPKDKLFDDRNRLARENFETISLKVGPAQPDGRLWLYELNDLTHAFQLRPVFHALEAEEKPRRRRISK